MAHRRFGTPGLYPMQKARSVGDDQMALCEQSDAIEAEQLWRVQ